MTDEKKNRKFAGLVLFGTVFLLAAVFLSLAIETESVSTKELVLTLFGQDTGKESISLILFKVRLPRTLGGVLCAASLAVSGMLLQTALDNPLCSPGVMGINSGAGVFVLLSGMMFPFSAVARQTSGFLGAMLATVIIYGVCRRAGFSKATLILAGVAVSSLFSAGSNAVITLHPGVVADKQTFSLGGLSGINWNQIEAALPWVTIGTVVVFLKADHFDLLRLGDESAAGLGVRASDMRKLALITAAVLAGSAVSICGMLGFIGLIIPNLIRRTGNFGIRRELVLCLVYGAGFLLVCDIIARYMLFPYELPVGLILSLLGAPFFICILIRRKRSVVS